MVLFRQQQSCAEKTSTLNLMMSENKGHSLLTRQRVQHIPCSLIPQKILDTVLISEEKMQKCVSKNPFKDNNFSLLIL